MPRRALLLVAVLFAVGCSGRETPSSLAPESTHDAGQIDTSTPDAGPPDAGPADAGAPDAGPVDAGFVTAPHAAFPVIADQGGPRLPHLKLVTITFPGFADEQDVAAFGDWVVGSDWLQAVGAEYGVGAGTHQHVALTDAAPTSVTTADTESFLLQKIADGTLPQVPANSPDQYLFMIFYPPGTTMADLPSSMGCSGNGDVYSSAWHESLHQGTTELAYAVIPTCSQESQALVELSAAHELIEAATDATPWEQPAFQLNASDPWMALGAEVADLCEGYDLVDHGFNVPRVWSNALAADGGSPCAPLDPQPYFAVSPPTDEVIQLAPGESITLEVTGWSTAPMPDWNVKLSAEGYSDFELQATLDRGTINNGEVAHLTLTVPAGTSPNGPYGPTTGSTLLYSWSGNRFTYWPIKVQVK